MFDIARPLPASRQEVCVCVCVGSPVFESTRVPSFLPSLPPHDFAFQVTEGLDLKVCVCVCVCALLLLTAEYYHLGDEALFHSADTRRYRLLSARLLTLRHRRAESEVNRLVLVD